MSIGSDGLTESGGGAVEPGALAGAAIAGVFGVAWTMWAATGLPEAASAVVRVLGVAFGLLVVVTVLTFRRSRVRQADPQNGSMFSSRPYLVIVALMVAAIVVGDVILSITGLEQYRIAWTAAMVGLHLLAFARMFWSGYSALAGAILTAAAAGAVTGSLSGDTRLITVITGIGAAGSLFIASGSTLIRSAASAAHRAS